MRPETIRAILTSALVLSVLACQAPQEESSTLTGQVRTASGEAPALAHVRLVDAADGRPLETVEAEGDGAFRIALPRAGVHRLRLTAVDHQMAEVPLLPGTESAAGLTVTLARNPYAETFETVRILGDWNGFRFDEADEMLAKGDGTFAFTVEEAEEAVRYQLLGITTNGHSVNGTQADFYEYDGGDDYYAVVAASDGYAEIDFDPAGLPPPGREGLPALDSPDEALVRAFSLSRLAAAADGQARKRYKSGDLDFAELYAAAREALLETVDDAAAPASLRGYAAARLISTPEDVCSADEIGRAVAQLAPSSPLWALSAHSLYRLGGEEADAALLEALRGENPVELVRGQALAQLIELARAGGEQERWRALYAELAEEFKDTPGLRYYRTKLNPDGRIVAGKPVPEFDVALLGDAASRISDESLRGSYYLIDFWATWCVPCVAEMPQLHEAWERWGGDGFQIVSLSFDDAPEAVQPFRDEEWAMPWLHTFVEEGFESDLAKSFEVSGIPMPLLVDPEGTIVATSETLRRDRLLVTLAENLNGEGAAAP